VGDKQNSNYTHSITRIIYDSTDDDHRRQGRSLFLQTMHDVIAASKSSSLSNDGNGSTSNDNSNDEATRLVDCARIRIDGSIISSSNNDGEDREQFSTAFCLPFSSSSRVGGGIGNNDQQMKTVAQLSAIHNLVGGNNGRAAAVPTNN
jgi:hypothetical protein